MNNIGKNCPFCQTPIKPGKNTVTCDKCKVVHHEECWKENNGCTTFGCVGKVGYTQPGIERSDLMSIPTNDIPGKGKNYGESIKRERTNLNQLRK